MKLFKALKAVIDEASGENIFWFIVLALILPPAALIWLAVLIIRKLDI